MIIIIIMILYNYNYCIMMQDVDILVFPEAGLTGVTLPDDRKEIRKFLTEIPSPESNTIPCFTQYCSTASTFR